MAVYTFLSEIDIKNLIKESYGLEIAQVNPVAEGIENSIYKLQSETASDGGTEGCYAFVIFETLELSLVEAYCSVFEKIADALSARLPNDDIQVPKGIRLLESASVTQGINQRRFSLMVESNGQFKPAVLQPWIQGGHRQSDAQLCHDLGHALGIINSLRPDLDTEDGIPVNQHLYRIQLVEENLNQHPTEVQQTFHKLKSQLKKVLSVHESLQSGLVHGDLFVDNALMDETKLTGIIDFFNASWSPLLLDLEICLMFLCVRDGEFDEELTRALIYGFRQKCEVVPTFDLEYWADLVRLAAFRFWCTRQEYYLICRQRGITPVQDREPEFCEKVFAQVDQQADFLNQLWKDEL